MEGKYDSITTPQAHQRPLGAPIALQILIHAGDSSFRGPFAPHRGAQARALQDTCIQGESVTYVYRERNSNQSPPGFKSVTYLYRDKDT